MFITLLLSPFYIDEICSSQYIFKEETMDNLSSWWTTDKKKNGNKDSLNSFLVTDVLFKHKF